MLVLLTFFGAPLKRGNIIIGVINSVFAFMGLCLYWVYANDPEQIFRSEYFTSGQMEAIQYLLGFCALMSAVKFVASILLIFGAANDQPKLLLPWLFTLPVIFVMAMIFNISLIVHYQHVGLTQHVYKLVFSTFLVISWYIYQGLVVLNYFNHLTKLNF